MSRVKGAFAQPNKDAARHSGAFLLTRPLKKSRLRAPGKAVVL